jgi:preprotein translocase subunit SecY
LLTFPAIIAGFFLTSETAWVVNLALNTQAIFGGGSDWYWFFYFIMVVGFAFFYYGENLKRSGAQIPGVSRGEPTQRYLTRVLRRITFPGAFFLGLVATTPFFVGLVLPSLSGSGTLLVTSTGLLIVVGVVRDTFFNIEAELKLHGYDETLLVR